MVNTAQIHDRAIAIATASATDSHFALLQEVATLRKNVAYLEHELAIRKVSQRFHAEALQEMTPGDATPGAQPKGSTK